MTLDSTGRGAVLEGFGFIGIAMDKDYVAIAEARIAAAVSEAEEEARAAAEAARQFDMFRETA